MAQEAGVKSPGMKPWLRVVLMVSLALNLLVAGLIVGRIAMHGPHHGPHKSRLDEIGGPITQALTQEDRREIGRKMRQTIRADGGGRAERHEVFEALIAQLRTEPFDREAVAGHFARQRTFLNERLTLGQGFLLEQLEGMGAAERAAFADRLEEKLNHRKQRK